MNDNNTYKVGIIGFGPKGFYGFERLVAYLNEAKVSSTIQIHIFNTTAFLASGDVYRTDQPAYLIMNYANRNINSWVVQEPFSMASATPDFVTWLTAKGHANAAPGKYAPRSLVGGYLSDCYQMVLEQLPKNVVVVAHIGRVTNMIQQNEDYHVFYTDRKTGEQDIVACNNILFTTGHHSFKAQKPISETFGNRIDFIYPTNEKLKSVSAASLVAIKGFGLTAIDAILALTEGKGGKFKKNDKGVLKYFSSGEEPYKIYPFSRTGLPMVPRNGSPTSDAQLYFFTEAVIAELKQNRPISFSCTILPLIKKEFYFTYYSVLFKNYGHQFYFDDDFTVMENQVQYFHEDYPECPVFNWETIINPFRDESVLSTVVIQVYIQFLIDEAKAGEDKSPFMAAVATWRKISPIFNELYSFGGLDAVSHKKFDSYYFGLFNRLSYGPPVKNMQKILALCKAGILDFTYVKSASITRNESKNNFSLYLENGKETDINYSINATISRAKEGEFENELYQNLLKNGLIREFENKLKAGYKPGCVAINKDGNAINEDGTINTTISFYGTPTEGITCDNDTLSRTRNDFATVWAKATCEAINKKDGSTENYEREENVL
ncbi:FAD/NAD(P)-binding protein [Maribacter ulvicola]|uniref:FAD-NAD(P)-binding n=1 Tax=Maribacter ulvicola TaxID=228959 RepID=A0A1N7A1S0_9FLAO|nr:FAD/NAD(P)-binding protein [Maribacter ulvicola]SIR32956.1 FAD-NAD(P)-binding [Maribacter ulvicola]